MVRALAFQEVAPGSTPVLTSGVDLFPVALDSTLPVGVLNHVSVKF